MNSVTVNTEVEVDIDDVLDSMSDEELRNAVAKRLTGIGDLPHVSQIYEAFRFGNRERVDQLLRDLFYNALGRVA